MGSTKGDGSIDAVLFDMDGTLIRSHYDWSTIRATLGVEGPSLIDALNALPEPRQSEAWSTLIMIERRASDAATLIDGVHALLGVLKDKGVRAALVTNNTDANTHALIDRFGLRFSVVLTRDSGFYKPSGAPLVEAMRRLEVEPDRTIAVGDSHYDVKAAREAGCAAVVVVNGGFEAHRESADLGFRSLGELADHLRIVL